MRQRPTIDWSAALCWTVQAGAREDAVLAAWRTGRAAEVPTGRLWDVLRVTRSIGHQAAGHLRDQGVPLGPVLDVPARATVEWVVPRGTARSWPPLFGTVCVGPGISRFPAPHIFAAAGHRAVCGRRWLTGLDPDRYPLTNSDALCEVITMLLARQAIRGDAARQQAALAGVP